MKNPILVKNEQEANRLAAQITLITILFLALVYTLNVLRIFIAPQGPMTIAMVFSTVMMVIPAFLVFVLKQDKGWVRYVIVTVCILMVAVLSLLLSWHVVLLFVYPVAIASLYFSRKLSWYAVILSLIMFGASQYGSLYAGGVSDRNLKDAYEVILYGVAPRSIELLALSFIFIRLSHRTKLLLENVVGAEEQKENLERIMALTDKSYEVTNVLADSVKELSSATSHALASNEAITKMTGDIVQGSQQTIQYVGEATGTVSGVATDLQTIARENLSISSLSHEAKSLSDSNSVNMKDAANGILQIHNSTKSSRDIILRLGEKSNEVANIAQVIQGIAESTSLLSLNASIESARAGEQGKGFAVVASEIRKLADQTQLAAGNIAKLIQHVVGDTQEAVESMDENTKLVELGKTLINKADKSSAEVSHSVEIVNEMARSIAELSGNLAENGKHLHKAVENISNLTTDNMDKLKGILQSSEEQLKAMNNVAVYVKSIDETSGELLTVVNQS